MVVVIENQILSPISVFKHYARTGKVLIEYFDNYNKRTYRNRFIILSPNGSQLVSIPLRKGKNNHTRFKDVEIAYDKPWISNLKNTFKTCYGSAPYFDFFFDELMMIFNKKPQFLFQLNSDLREYILDVFEIDVEIVQSDLYRMEYGDGFLDIRDKYLPAGELKKGGDNPKVKYPQVFEEKIGFFPNPSIVDLLFNMGKYGGELLRRIK